MFNLCLPLCASYMLLFGPHRIPLLVGINTYSSPLDRWQRRRFNHLLGFVQQPRGLGWEPGLPCPDGSSPDLEALTCLTSYSISLGVSMHTVGQLVLRFHIFLFLSTRTQSYEGREERQEQAATQPRKRSFTSPWPAPPASALRPQQGTCHPSPPGSSSGWGFGSPRLPYTPPSFLPQPERLTV